MENWKIFEINCLQYLNDTFANERVLFLSTGGSNSNTPDICVCVDNKQAFNIEVKSASAQSGQFVVLQENDKFDFSCRNKSQSQDAIPFIDYMNNNFDKYKNAGTAGVNVDLPKEEFLSWIISHYKSKNEQFVITKKDDNFIIFPIDKYGDYFETTCKYRVKKSGSSDIPAKHISQILEHFELLDSNARIVSEGKKVYLDTIHQMIIKEIFSVGQNKYMVSDIIDGKYYIRKLSNTFNANIIFTIKLKQDQQQSDLELFKKELLK